MNSSSKTIEHLFGRSAEDYGDALGSAGAWMPLLLLLIWRFATVPIALSLPLPTGLFMPIFMMGAIVGHLFGIVALMLARDSQWIDNTLLEPGIFAVIGAAAFAAGSTRAISTAIIVMELTGQMTLQLPVAIAVLTAFFTANRISTPIYDLLIRTNRIVHLPKITEQARGARAEDVMQPIVLDTVVGRWRRPEPRGGGVGQSSGEAGGAVSAVHTSTSSGSGASGDDDSALVVRRARADTPVGGLDISRDREEQKMEMPPVLHAGVTMGKAATLLQMWTDVTSFALVDHEGYLIGEVARSQLLKEVERFPSLLRGAESGASIDDSVEGALTPIEYIDRAKGGGVIDPLPGGRAAGSVAVTADTSPMQIMHLTLLERIDVLVRMLRLDHLWVVKKGKLVGVVTKASMMENVPKVSAFDLGKVQPYLEVVFLVVIPFLIIVLLFFPSSLSPHQSKSAFDVMRDLMRESAALTHPGRTAASSIGGTGDREMHSALLNE